MPATKKKKKKVIAVNTVVDVASEVESFHKELQNFSLHLPGSRNVFRFDNDEILLNFMQKQYPDWKCSGHVTSVPIGRVPRIFLKANQLAKELEKNSASLQKGESGEIRVYNSLMESAGTLTNGILVLPNLDGNHFSTKIAHVEIDTVIVHPLHGIFVVNIKNANRVKESELVKDMIKHTRYIRMIRDFGNDKDQDIGHKVPVHGIVCSFLAEVNEDVLNKSFPGESSEKIFVFQPDDMKDFASAWATMLLGMPDTTTIKEESLDVLACRLVALNSIEGGVALLHKKMVTNELQTQHLVNRDATLENMLNEASGTNPDDVRLLKEDVLSLQDQETPVSKSKKPLILWTKEQLDIISNVGRNLLHPTSRHGCRILVAGPKGSGKTMLLVYLAQLANHMFCKRSKVGKGNIAVYDGRMGNSLLAFEDMKEKLMGSDIEVSTTWTVDSFIHKKLVLIDEAVFMTSTMLLKALKGLTRHQHAILFSSDSAFVDTVKETYPWYKLHNLTTSLRSTGAITRFVEKYRCLDPHSCILPSQVSHNLEGEPPEVRFVSDDSHDDPEQSGYVREAVEAIVKCANQSRGLETILVAPFVHPVVLKRIIVQLYRHGLHYQYRNPAEYSSKSVPHDETGRLLRQFLPSVTPEYKPVPRISEGDLPLITFITGNHVDGSEFAASVVLVERSLPHFWDDFIFDSLYIALTRTTTKLCVVVNDAEKPPVITQKPISSNEDSVPSHWKSFSKPNSAKIYAYSWIQTPVNLFSEKLSEIIIESRWVSYPVLVIGNLSFELDMEEIPITERFLFNELHDSREFLKKHQQFYGCDSTKWFKGPYDKTVISSTSAKSLPCHMGEVDGFHLNKRKDMYSAIVFLINTPDERLEILNAIGRHKLLFDMYDNDLGNCPIYVLSSSPPNSSRLNSAGICDRLTDHYGRKGDRKEKRDVVETVEEVFSAEDLKAKGNAHFKNDELILALESYKASVKMYRAEYEDAIVVPGCNVEALMSTQRTIAILHTNISKVLFELAKREDSCMAKVEMSLQHSEKATEMDPFWSKGFYRMFQALEQLGDTESARKSQENHNYLEKLAEGKKVRNSREQLIRRIMKRSVSWSLVKYQDNAYLVDINGYGHFKFLHEALAETSLRPVSLLVNPGEYNVLGIMIPFHRIVDIVGNWEPSCEENGWIQKDSPVVIQNSPCGKYRGMRVILPTFIVQQHATLHLSRVSVYNWQTELTHAVSGEKFSTVNLYQCAVNSQHGAAVTVINESKLTMNGCRSVDAYSVVLVFKNCNVYIKNSFFSRSRHVGVELREETDATIEGCMFTRCEGAGLGGSRCTLTVDSCTFENNSTGNSMDEGSIQLRFFHAIISNSLIQCQMGNGIVMEEGSGSFNNLKIDDCQNSGLLIMAPITVQGCRITNCTHGITVCARIVGGTLKIRDNFISRCRFDVFRNPGAVYPEINGVISPCSNDVGFAPFPQDMIKMDEIEKGRKCHLRILEKQRIMNSVRSLMPMDVVKTSELNSKLGGCMYCSKHTFSSRDVEYVVCESCKKDHYCSVECQQKDKKYHQHLCEWTVKVTTMYLVFEWASKNFKF